MYDIKPLEEEWDKYRKSKRKPYIMMGLAILFLGAGAGVLYYLKDKGLLVMDRDRNNTKEIKHEKITFIENEALMQLEVEKPKEIEPIMQKEHEEVSSEIVEDLPLSKEKRKRKKPRVKMNIVTTEMPKVRNNIQEEEKPHKRKYLAIKKISGSSAYEEVAERFRETQDTDDSLFLAKAYYNQGKYSKAAYWAFQTNNINSGIEESILIFVKAKVKLGQKNEAIRILKKYIAQSDSMKAKKLLQKIKKGKI
jgi:tetratricopeptide (TPR) repeat protein